MKTRFEIAMRTENALSKLTFAQPYRPMPCLASNLRHAPQPAENIEQTDVMPVEMLNAKEAAMIEKLIDLCTSYQEQGNEDLSQLIDRIGVNMMQAFLSRAAPQYAHQNK